MDDLDDEKCPEAVSSLTESNSDSITVPIIRPSKASIPIQAPMTNADWNGLTSFYRGFFSHVGMQIPFPRTFTRVDAAFYFSYLFINATERIRMLKLVRTDDKLNELYDSVENE